MSSELSILALTGLLIIVILLVQVLMATGQFGLAYLATPRDEGRELTGTAARCKRALDNSVIALTLFAPAILILQAQGGFSANSLLAAQAFLIARIIYPVIYIMGIPWLRTGVWMVGFLATAWLYVMAL